MKAKDDADRLSVAVNLRLSPDDAARLDALAERLTVVTRHGIARAAIRLGLALLEEDPSRMFAEPEKTSAKSRRR